MIPNCENCKWVMYKDDKTMCYLIEVWKIKIDWSRGCPHWTKEPLEPIYDIDEGR